MKPTYRVFKRRPWHKGPPGWEPNGGARKTTVESGLSYDEAFSLCMRENRDVKRKDRGQMYYEFERE